MAQDDQAGAEAIDETMLGADEADSAAVPTDFPPEHTLGAEDYGTREVEEQIPESLIRREARMQHPGDVDRDVVDPDDPLQPSGAPVSALLDDVDDAGVDSEADLVADLGDEEDAMTAEEAAMHVTSDPPYGRRDSYLNEEG